MDGRIVRVREVVPPATRAPRSVLVRCRSGRSIRVRVVTTAAGFGGRRAWLVCRGCERRVAHLFIGDRTAECRWCRGVRYPSRVYHRTRSWNTWGRLAHRLARVRAILARKYLRLARRGALERLASRLEAEVCRALDGELTASLGWISQGRGGVHVAVGPLEAAV